MAETRTESPASEPRLGDGCIRVRGLARSFGERAALRPLDLTIGTPGRGGVTGLLGPNGSGKSTLLRTLTGLVRPDAGTAWVDGVRLAGDGTAVRRRCAYSPGELSIYDEMRAGEHLTWFLRGRGREARERAFETARAQELPLRDFVRSYSHGMKRQLIFAAALAPRVNVRILDEPTEGLDPSRRARVLDLLRADADAGTTVLLSSHHLGEVARACDELVFMSRGEVLAVERPEEIERRSRRSVRLTFATAEERARAQERLERRTDLALTAGDRDLRIVLDREDPRAFLASLDALPEPRTLAYGELSLEQLYRDLYGVEGI